MNSIRFEKGNKIRFLQDHRFFEGMPDDVDLFPTEVENGFVTLIGDGHGARNDNGVMGRYGNGAIYVSEDQLRGMPGIPTTHRNCPTCDTPLNTDNDDYRFCPKCGRTFYNEGSVAKG